MKIFDYENVRLTVLRDLVCRPTDRQFTTKLNYYNTAINIVRKNVVYDCVNIKGFAEPRGSYDAQRIPRLARVLIVIAILRPLLWKEITHLTPENALPKTYYRTRETIGTQRLRWISLK